MTRDDWLELTVLERKKYNLLVEIQDATRQLAETLDRNDEVAVRMMVTMRQDPIRHLAEVDGGEKARRAALPEEDGRRVEVLLEGGEPRDDGERVFMDQVGKTRRLLKQVMDLDRRINIRMAGDHSFYKK
ncbi:MAG: hypothetical protein HDT14_08725 [Oscillibacter sp.]|nr:hypothetical protein [Oscillibacter sp.]